MRIAIVSDIHGNLTAFEAVLADLERVSPDAILHGGDLADGGSSPVEIVDRIRELGWPGVRGNTDEMLADPDTFESFAAASPQLGTLWSALRDMASFSRGKLGAERLAWLGALPASRTEGSLALVHALPADRWRAPLPEATDAELRSAYAVLGQPTVVYGHVHHPFVRQLSGDGLPRILTNSGSVGLPHDGDPRASYLVVDDGQPVVQRVAYDIERELELLEASGLPHADWVAKILRTAAPAMP